MAYRFCVYLAFLNLMHTTFQKFGARKIFNVFEKNNLLLTKAPLF